MTKDLHNRARLVIKVEQMQHPGFFAYEAKARIDEELAELEQELKKKEEEEHAQSVQALEVMVCGRPFSRKLTRARVACRGFLGRIVRLFHGHRR